MTFLSTTEANYEKVPGGIVASSTMVSSNVESVHETVQTIVESAWVLDGERDSILKDDFDCEEEEGCVLFGDISPKWKSNLFILQHTNIRYAIDYHSPILSFMSPSTSE